MCWSGLCISAAIADYVQGRSQKLFCHRGVLTTLLFWSDVASHGTMPRPLVCTLWTTIFSLNWSGHRPSTMVNIHVALRVLSQRCNNSLFHNGLMVSSLERGIYISRVSRVKPQISRLLFFTPRRHSIQSIVYHCKYWFWMGRLWCREFAIKVDSKTVYCLRLWWIVVVKSGSVVNKEGSRTIRKVHKVSNCMFRLHYGAWTVMM